MFAAKRGIPSNASKKRTKTQRQNAKRREKSRALRQQEEQQSPEEDAPDDGRDQVEQQQSGDASPDEHDDVDVRWLGWPERDDAFTHRLLTGRAPESPVGAGGGSAGPAEAAAAGEPVPELLDAQPDDLVAVDDVQAFLSQFSKQRVALATIAATPHAASAPATARAAPAAYTHFHADCWFREQLDIVGD